MKKVLAFFGAFNPPTVAHLSLAEYACKNTEGCTGVVFVPSKSLYIHDVQRKDFAYSDLERLEMLKAAARTREWMTVCDIEIKSQTQPRTYDTLCKLKTMGFSPSLLLGSDKLPELEKGWRHVGEIASEFGIVCLARGDDECSAMIKNDYYLSSLSPYIKVLKTPDKMHYVSSSAVREKLLLGDAKAAEKMLSPEVWERLKNQE